jgi:hypothetical protein
LLQIKKKFIKNIQYHKTSDNSTNSSGIDSITNSSVALLLFLSLMRGIKTLFNGFDVLMRSCIFLTIFDHYLKFFYFA